MELMASMMEHDLTDLGNELSLESGLSPIDELINFQWSTGESVDQQISDAALAGADLPFCPSSSLEWPADLNGNLAPAPNAHACVPGPESNPDYLTGLCVPSYQFSMNDAKDFDHVSKAMSFRARPLDSAPAECFPNLVQTSPQTTAGSRFMCTIRGLLPWISIFELCSPTLCPSNPIQAKILDHDPRAIPGYLSATLLFSTQSGAESARDLMYARQQNFNNLGPIQVEITPDIQASLEVVTIDQQPTKRHKFSKEDKVFLEEQFNENSRPSAQRRRELANELKVNEKRIMTWFNNHRQRQKAEATEDKDSATESLTTPISISRKRLSQMSQKSGNLSESPIERFQNSPPGCEGEPSLEVIAAAAGLSLSTRVIKALEYIRGGSGSPAAAYPISSPPAKSSDVTRSRSMYARSVTSARSSRSHRSDQSCGSGRSSGSTQSGRSSCSIASRASKLSRNSNLSRIQKSSHEFPRSRTSRNDTTTSKQLVRRRYLNFLTTQSCPKPKDIYPQEKERRDVTLSRLKLHVSVAIECHSCRQVAQEELGELQASGIYCSHCLEYLGLCRISCTGFDIKLKVCCPTCSGWVDATVPDRYTSEILKAVADYEDDYEFDCSVCYRRPLFMATVNVARRTYDCTFCEMTFRTKFGWERHETSQHEPQSLWICPTDSPISLLAMNCHFCESLNIDTNHLDIVHRFEVCRSRPVEDRSYCRKDQLVQHLQGFHRCCKLPLHLIDTCSRKLIQRDSAWECGVCRSSFTDWTERLKHVGQHWDDGLNKEDWKGNHEALTNLKPPIDSRGSSSLHSSPPISSALVSFVDVPQSHSKPSMAPKSGPNLSVPNPENNDFSLPTTSQSVYLGTSGLGGASVTQPSLVSGIWSRVKATARVFRK